MIIQIFFKNICDKKSKNFEIIRVKLLIKFNANSSDPKTLEIFSENKSFF